VRGGSASAARAPASAPISSACRTTLDVWVRALILNLFIELSASMDFTLIFVSHDLSVVRHVCERVAVMHQGELVELDETEQLHDGATELYTRSLLAAAPTSDPPWPRPGPGPRRAWPNWHPAVLTSSCGAWTDSASADSARHSVRVNPRSTSAHTELAVQIARADLAYVCGALTKPGDPTSNWLFIQYAAMAAYETRAFLTRQLKVELEEPLWEPNIAAAARTSGKFFDDKARMFAGVVDYFEELSRANRSLFFPAKRLAIFDVLRTDISILTLDGVPVTSNLSGYFAIGTDPARVVDMDAIGPQLGDLAAGVGQMVRLIDAPRDHAGPDDYSGRDFRWWDADGRMLWSRVCGGDLEPAIAAAVLTLQGAASSAHRLARSRCCESCRRAAFKHRLVVAYQAVLAVEQVVANLGSSLRSGARTLGVILADDACRRMRSDGYRRLRNGLLHLGLTDIPADPDATLPFDDVLTHYAEVNDPQRVHATVEQALATVARGLETWVQTPAPRLGGFRSVLREPAP
jgi:hypothetical protein